MSVVIRPIEIGEVPDFLRVTWAAFGFAPTGATEGWTSAVEIGRAFAAFDDGRPVGSTCAFSLHLTVPGLRTLPAAGLSMVGVLPTHRRRGVLRQLMARHFDDVRERAEPLAVLTASESSIYGRYGYGPATYAARYEIEPARAALSHPESDAGTVTLLDRDAAEKVLPEVHDRVRSQVPGELSRTAGLWTGTWAELDEEAGGTSPWLAVVHTDATGEYDGYALHRVEDDAWEAGISRQRVTAQLAAGSTDARLALWRYLLGLDLTEEVRLWGPVDDPVRWRLADPRRLRTTSLVDHLWLRIFDVPAALEARAYAAEDALTVEVVDPVVPDVAGTYTLEAGPDGAACGRTGREPDLVMDVQALASIYLGTVSPGRLHRAGRIDERRPGACDRADVLLRTATAPWCGTEF